MKTNKQKKIKVPQSGNKRSRFNWAHDVNTTYSWGEIQPTQVKMIQPGSKTTMKAQSLIRLAPMVAPTFGRVKYKTFNQFVEIEDIFPNYGSLMSQEPINRNGRIKVAQALPAIKLGQLSAWCLQGARASLYWVDEGASEPSKAQLSKDGKYRTSYRKINTYGPMGSISTSSEASTMLQYLVDKQVLNFVNTSQAWSNIPGAPKLNIGNNVTNDRFVVMYPRNMGSSWGDVWYGDDGPNNVADYCIVLSTAQQRANLIPVDPGQLADAQVIDSSACNIPLDTADYVVEFSVQTVDSDSNPHVHYYAMAFEFSDFGKRLRKILQGCGYQINLHSSEYVSILPLLAQYKAYFDIFGLQLYQNWETTYCAKLIDYIKTNFIETVEANTYRGQASNANKIYGFTPSNTVSMTDMASSFCSFMLAEVANEWYTEDPDFIGAHMSKLAVSPNGPEGSGNNFISVDGGGIDFGAHVDNGVSAQVGTLIDYGSEDTHGESASLATSYTQNGVHAYITQLQHSQVDAELLKRLYRWTNRNTVLGREIAKILRAQGLGKFVDECKSDFIGATDNVVTISDVVSMADTDNGQGQGALLGEYGGRGLSYLEDKVLVFENTNLGFWVTLATIVPESGYTQGLDPTLKCLDKFSLYNPDFDAVGMELTTKDAVVGNAYLTNIWNTDVNLSAVKGFGFVPRDSKWKVAYNLVNGDFNRRPTRSTYLPYTLDKQLNVNDMDISWQNLYTNTDGFLNGYFVLDRSIATERLPVAGNLWRCPTKYPWMGNFDRIFANTGKKRPDSEVDADGYSTYRENTAIGFCDFNADNFLSHEIMDVQCYAPMKPIEDSYGLEDDDAHVRGVEYDVKA